MNLPGGVTLDEAGGMCPFQALGRIHGHPFYFRYRWGAASLTIARPGGSAVFDPVYSVGVQYGHDLDGHLSTDEFEALFARLSAAFIPTPLEGP